MEMETVTPPEDIEWTACSFRMRQLQHIATALRDECVPGNSSKDCGEMLHIVLKTMQSFRRSIDEELLSEGKNDGITMDKIRSTWFAKIDRIVRFADTFIPQTVPSLEMLQREREANLCKELSAAWRMIGRAVEPRGGDLRLSEVSMTNGGALPLIVDTLRELEFSRHFHQKLLSDLSRTETVKKYSSENFAYGSTPLSTWHKVCSIPCVRQVIDQCTKTLQQTTGGDKDDEDDAACVVLGSSSGSLVAFTSLLYNVRCAGVEILPYLHGIAQRLKHRYKLQNCVFLLADMLEISLTNPRLVVLTSQCWDEDLYRRVQQKLEQVLRPGSLVIDYRDGLTHSPFFSLAARIDGLQVSWNPAQTFFVFERRHSKHV